VKLIKRLITEGTEGHGGKKGERGKVKGERKSRLRDGLLNWFSIPLFPF
jgi:hypothetical protein